MERLTSPAALWPVAFSPQFVAGSRALLEHHDVLLIVGSPGSNRHRLARAVVAEGQRGLVWEHTCLHDDRNVPLRTLSRLLARIGGGADVPPDETADEIRKLVRASESDPPTLLLMSPDFADPASMDALTDLVASGDLRVVTAMTPESEAMTPRLSAMAARLDLDPLDERTVTRLLRARLGAEPHEVLVGFVHQRSQGAYGSVCHLGDLLQTSGALIVVEGVVMIDPDRIEAARLALPTLRRALSADVLGGAPGIVTLLELVSVIGEVELAEASACLRPDDIVHAVRHGTLRVRDGVLTMADPLEGEAVTAAMTTARLAELWTGYADRLQASVLRPESAIRTVRWCVWSGRPVPPDLVVVAARAANHRSLYQRAIEITDPALASADPMVTQEERAHALAQVGDTAGLAALQSSLDPAQVPEDELFLYMRWAPRVLPAAERALHRERAIGPEHDAETRRRREVVIELAELYVRAFCESRPEMVRRVRTLTLSGQLSPINEAMAHAVLASLLRHAGRPIEAVHWSRAAVNILESPEINACAALLQPVQEVLFIALISAFEPREARAVLDRYQRGSVYYGLSGRVGLLMSGMLDLVHGRAAVGLANARLFLARGEENDALGYRGWVEATAAQVLALLDRPSEALQMLEASEARPVHQRRQSDLERRQAQALVHDILGDPDRALSILDGTAAEAHRHGLLLAELDALGLAVLVDGPRRGRQLFDAVSDLDQPSGAAEVWQEFARAVVAYDFDELAVLSERLASTGHRLFAARIAQFTLDAGRRAADLLDGKREKLEHLVSVGAMPTR